ncbi:hypothetical protein N7449_004343 [Penicillium cf. viridicatum]|uniref:Putative 5'-nucleotidase C-terminal domain-containing protein n=1 Tax=Penicillium cf. viridicatum TaxID=2972119 RepID=A0A9W9JF37_9EURO|nr:hypothetical protein N7449_009313 [Penicillium cf. viridicatum]KAJ5202264.1 hypothetical protein N7449_004343 [Penicillium cf. viridicatum]
MQPDDTHGWLEGHVKERNYGADWGDFVSFAKHIQDKPVEKNVDLLLIDTSDLHNRNGLSDVTTPNGEVTNPIFENIDYDLLTPGNHKLIAADVAYNTFTKFSKVEPDEREWVSIGRRSRYFTTKQGLRIMAFGVILNRTNNNKDITRIQPAAEMIEEDWFKDTVNRQDIDLFVLIGHNPVKPRIPKSESSFPLLMDTLRTTRPEIPVQGFGGHTHRRDFHIYDNISIKSQPVQEGVASPEVKNALVNKSTIGESADESCSKTKDFDIQLTRRYLDWNRLAFAYHATGSQNILNTPEGLNMTKGITDSRNSLNLTFVYGCAPQTYCILCKPFGDEGNIYTLVQTAAAATVVDLDRSANSRMIIVNQGAIRYDLVQGPFTVDDAYIVCPYTTTFRFIADVPYSLASKVLDYINKPKTTTKRSITVDTISSQMLGYDECNNPSPHNGTKLLKPKSLFRRVLDVDTPTPGYTTCDDLGDDGDDTPHSEIPEYTQPAHVQATAAFPQDGEPDKVDLIFSDFLGSRIATALNSANPPKNYTTDDTRLYYLPEDFTTNTFLPTYASMAWQDNINDCPIGG